MNGSEIDIVQDKVKEAVRSYRTKDTTKKSPDRIVHGLWWEGKKEEK